MIIYYYVSGHGFGHISRTSVILKKLLERPEISKIHLVSTRIGFIDWHHPKLIKRELGLDVGVYQKDSLSIDIQKTKDALQIFERSKNSFLTSEALYCRQHQVDLIITDAGSFPIVLALEAELPSIFIGNFTWDFVYENYGKVDPYFFEISEILKAEYSFATEALFLPFTCPMPTFLESSTVGMVGRKPHLAKAEARELYGFSKDITYILISFGAYGLSGFEMRWDNLPKHIKLVASGVPGIDLSKVVTPIGGYYPDLVRASDYVLTKPGYGIMSEVFYAETPVIYTDRGDFSEYPFLVDVLQKKFPSSYITHHQISNCSFEDSISNIQMGLGSKKLLDIEPDGEDTIIKHILEYT
ncbi:glycosyl transferase [Leptospira ognonensis]|uniref:Glycosyl transferase n=1 Tax=Leptospira ognonensis TaxID=2484945 RepID=A0A4R9K019_9LEPT|nr:glycosyl transferase [Leptospira ognonensis]TGL58012.1 glycosyl transferase [Leptospira ognonensis]